MSRRRRRRLRRVHCPRTCPGARRPGWEVGQGTTTRTHTHTRTHNRRVWECRGIRRSCTRWCRRICIRMTGAGATCMPQCSRTDSRAVTMRVRSSAAPRDMHTCTATVPEWVCRWMGRASGLTTVDTWECPRGCLDPWRMKAARCGGVPACKDGRRHTQCTSIRGMVRESGRLTRGVGLNLGCTTVRSQSCHCILAGGCRMVARRIPRGPTASGMRTTATRHARLRWRHPGRGAVPTVTATSTLRTEHMQLRLPRYPRQPTASLWCSCPARTHRRTTATDTTLTASNFSSRNTETAELACHRTMHSSSPRDSSSKLHTTSHLLAAEGSAVAAR
eukprot:Opistho-2@21259